MTINHDSWINQAIALCGGQNIFASAKTAAPEIDLEAVIAANPEVIVAADETNAWQQRWQEYKEISAVKNNRYATIHPDLIDRAGPRLVSGVRQLCAALDTSKPAI